MHLTYSEASSFIGVSPSTLRRYERLGLIQAKRTVGGHRRYLIADLRALIGDAPEKEYTIAYARVSSHDQKDDLGRQIQRLESYCKQSGEDYIVLDDLGSGLNYKKRGLKKLIREIISGRVSRIVLTHKDRLLRFGSEIIFYLCSFFGCKIELIEEDQALSDEEILTRDVIEIITVFSARLYGKRAHQKKSLTPS